MTCAKPMCIGFISAFTATSHDKSIYNLRNAPAPSGGGGVKAYDDFVESHQGKPDYELVYTLFAVASRVRLCHVRIRIRQIPDIPEQHKRFNLYKAAYFYPIGLLISGEIRKEVERLDSSDSKLACTHTRVLRPADFGRRKATSDR